MLISTHDKGLTDLDNFLKPTTLAEEITENLESGLASFFEPYGQIAYFLILGEAGEAEYEARLRRWLQ